MKRSECKCICHTDAVVLGWITGPMHVQPCCEENRMKDNSLRDVQRQPLRQTDELFDKIAEQTKFLKGRTISVLEKEIWNAAIEAAALIADEADEIAAADIRRLKK